MRNEYKIRKMYKRREVIYPGVACKEGKKVKVEKETRKWRGMLREQKNKDMRNENKISKSYWRRQITLYFGVICKEKERKNGAIQINQKIKIECRKKEWENEK